MRLQGKKFERPYSVVLFHWFETVCGTLEHHGYALVDNECTDIAHHTLGSNPLYGTSFPKYSARTPIPSRTRYQTRRAKTSNIIATMNIMLPVVIVEGSLVFSSILKPTTLRLKCVSPEPIESDENKLLKEEKYKTTATAKIPTQKPSAIQNVRIRKSKWDCK